MNGYVMHMLSYTSGSIQTHSGVIVKETTDLKSCFFKSGTGFVDDIFYRVMNGKQSCTEVGGFGFGVWAFFLFLCVFFFCLFGLVWFSF